MNYTLALIFFSKIHNEQYSSKFLVPSILISFTYLIILVFQYIKNMLFFKNMLKGYIKNFLSDIFFIYFAT